MHWDSKRAGRMDCKKVAAKVPTSVHSTAVRMAETTVPKLARHWEKQKVGRKEFSTENYLVVKTAAMTGVSTVAEKESRWAGWTAVLMAYSKVAMTESQMDAEKVEKTGL